MNTLELIMKHRLNVLFDYGDYPVVITCSKHFKLRHLARAKTIEEAVRLAVLKIQQQEN